MKDTNEISMTIKYLRTLKSIFEKEGFYKALKHELVSFYCSSNYRGEESKIEEEKYRKEVSLVEEEKYRKSRMEKIRIERANLICNPNLVEIIRDSENKNHRLPRWLKRRI